MAFIAGCPLLLIGLMGSSFADCPRPIAQFPESEWYCTAFSSVTAVSLLLLLVGSIGFAAAGIWDAIREERRIGHIP